MENRGLNGLRDIGGVDRGAGIAWKSGKAHLVVHHHVDGAARAVGPKLGHLQGLKHHTLTRHRRITVNQYRQNPEVARREAILFCPDNTLEHAVHGFQVGWVCRQIDRDLLSAGAGVGAFRPQVVLHITRALNTAGVACALKLTEDLSVGLSSDIG
ncbi:MAG: Uncharacterised protein [Cellulomonadaceae bacterium TMED98]|nr:MAG: Uncharacterised protein [Cellulomonadaceae bacterium TMED98]